MTLRTLSGVTADPYDLIPYLEGIYGSVFFYRLNQTLGDTDSEPSPIYLYVSLKDALIVYQDKIIHGQEIKHIDTLVDEISQLFAAPLSVSDHSYDGDVVFACGYEFSYLWQKCVLRQRLRVEFHEILREIPLAFFCKIKEFCVFSPSKGEISVVTESSVTTDQIESDLASFSGEKHANSDRTHHSAQHLLPEANADEYKRRLQALMPYFDRGEAYQIVLSTCIEIEMGGQIDLHRYFKVVSQHYAKAKFSYYFSIDGVTTFGNCSLPHIIKTNSRISTFVFAGTGQAPSRPDEGQTISMQMLRDPKYRSEHIMLVDLERNDFGKICRYGSVKVEKFMEPVIIGPTTYLSTTIVGEVSKTLKTFEVLMSTFPRGVVTGAPKVRSQEILWALENRPRGFYTGMMGLCQKNGDIVSNTIVTTGSVIEDQLLLSCAGGITHESDPEQELRELSYKFSVLLGEAQRFTVSYNSVNAR